MRNRNPIVIWSIVVATVFIGFIGFTVYNIYTTQEDPLAKAWRERESNISTSPPLSRTEIFKDADYLAMLKVTARKTDSEGAVLENFFVMSGLITDRKNAYGKYLVVSAGHIDFQMPGVTIYKVEAMFKNGQGPEELEVAKIDHDIDTAILVFKNKDFKFTGKLARLGDSDTVSVGDEVIALGSPHGILNYLSVGYVGRNDTNCLELLDAGFEIPVFCPLIAHSATTNPGCSGGPLLNAKGEVIGLHSILLNSPSKERPNHSPISVAIPINYVLSIIE